MEGGRVPSVCGPCVIQQRAVLELSSELNPRAMESCQQNLWREFGSLNVFPHLITRNHDRFNAQGSAGILHGS